MGYLEQLIAEKNERGDFWLNGMGQYTYRPTLARRTRAEIAADPKPDDHLGCGHSAATLRAIADELDRLNASRPGALKQ